MAVTAFNAKLQATAFEVKKGTDFYIKKQYQFYADGSLKFIDDQLSDNFDRLYKYDFAGRTVEAKAGTAARGQTPTPPHNFDQPYTMQYTHNAFGHLTSKTGYYYSSYDTNSYGYDANNRNPGWVYDADGNVTSDNDAVYETDAAGRLTKTTERKLDDSSQFDAPTADSFDGDGQLVKRVTNVGSTTPAEMKRYYIRSSVLNKVVSEANATGKKLKTFVPANGVTLAEQSVDHSSGTPFESLSFFHQDASGTGAQKTLANGSLVGNTTHSRAGEYSPLGRNIADAGPYITLNTTEPPDEGGANLFGSGQGYRPGRNSYSIDGLSVPEDRFAMEINSGQIGGAFGLLEIAARMSAREILGYTVTVRDGNMIVGAQGFDNLGDARDFAISRGMTTVDRWIQLNNWQVIGLLATQTQRQTQQTDFNLGNKGVAFTAKEKSALNAAFKYVNSETCLKWINGILEPFVRPWAEGEVKTPPFAISAEDLLSKVTLNRYSSSLTAQQMGFTDPDREATKKNENTLVGVTQRSTPSIFLFKLAFYEPGTLTSIFVDKTDLPGSIVHEMLHAFGLRDPDVRNLNGQIQKNCGWGGHVSD